MREYKKKKKKEYDPIIVNLYTNGKIMIDNNIYSLKNFYLDYNNNVTDYDVHLNCVESNYTDILIGTEDKYEYTGSVLFKDSTVFIELISNPQICEIKDDTIIVKDKQALLNLVQNWDGYLHDKVSKTDAVSDKVILKRRTK